jgi:uncharacterized damage-inducible protein DinB
MGDQSSMEGRVKVAQAFADMDDEFEATRRMLERFPDDQAEWKPHEKSMSLIQLAAHIAQLPQLAHLMATEPEWNAEDRPYVPPKARNAEELVALFDELAPRAKAAILALDAAAMDEPWRMRNGETVYFEGPRGVLLRRFLVSHTAHHRGQLTVYYRLLGVPLPGIYGPTADGM